MSTPTSRGAGPAGLKLEAGRELQLALAEEERVVEPRAARPQEVIRRHEPQVVRVAAVERVELVVDARDVDVVEEVESLGE
jgi:hypothetical protein